MKLQACLVIVCTTILVGCAAPPKRPDLKETPHANVRVLSNLHRFAYAGFLKEKCVPQTTFGWESSTENIGIVEAKGNPKRESIGMPLPNIASDAGFVEMNIPVGQPISIGLSTLGLFHLMACGSGVIFTPVEGANYQITYQRTSGASCSSEVQLIKTAPSGEVTLEPVLDAKPAPSC